MTQTSPTSDGHGLGDLVADPFEALPQVVLVQPEEPGIIEWILEFIQVLFGLLIGAIFWVVVPAVVAFVIATGMQLPDVVCWLVTGIVALLATGWLFGPMLISYLKRRGCVVEICERGIRARYDTGEIVEIAYSDIAGFDGATCEICPNGRFWGENWEIVLYRECEERLQR